MSYGFLAEPSPPPKVDAAHVVATLSSNVSSNNAVRQRFLFITILLVLLTLLFTGVKVQKISDYQTPFFMQVLIKIRNLCAIRLLKNEMFENQAFQRLLTHGKKELSLLKTGKSKAEVEFYYEIICCMLKNVYLYSRNWFSPSQGQLKGWLSSSERLKGNRV